MFNPGILIKECLDSIFTQEYSDYEVLVIDDGSTDNSNVIVQSYIDHRLKYHRLENNGANNARNYGLKNSSGDLIFFMDQDDFLLHKNFFSVVNNYFTLNPFEDFLIFKYIEFFQRDTVYKKRPDFLPMALKSTDKYVKLKSFVKHGNIPISPWDKVFQRNFLINSNINFPVGLIAGDINWFIELIEKSKSFIVINEEFYAYRRQVNSSITNSFSVNKFENFLYVIELETNNVLRKYETPFKELYLSFLAYEYSILIASLPNLNKSEYLLFINRIESLKWILKYDENKKVKQVKILLKFFGFRNGSKVLNYYIKKFVNRN